jgi:chaperonin GroES
MTEWNVLYDKVLVRRDAAATEKGGLAVPTQAQRKQSQGTVISTGLGRPNGNGGLTPLTVRPGDVVRFTSFSGVSLSDDDEDVILLREDELLAYQRDGV